MALAYLEADDANPERYEFIADLGTNEYYEYKIGSARSRDELDSVELVSELQHVPPHNALSTQFRLRIPAQSFSRRSRALQLCSYRDAQRNGPAFSRILLVVPQLAHVAAPLASASTLAGPSMLTAPPFETPRAGDFSFQESTLSHGMFLQELLGALRTVAPSVLQLLPSLLGTGGAAPAAGAPGGAQGALTPELLTRLLQMIGGAGGAATGQQPAAAPPAAPAAATPAVPPAPPQPPATPAQAQSLAWRGAGSTRSRFALSRQQDGGLISGPLLASLLGPMLQQAPQLLQVLTDRPLQFLTSILQTQLQRRQNEQNFMAGLLAEVNRSALLRELLRESNQPLPAAAPSMSMAAAAPATWRARELQSVHLRFDAGPSLRVGSKHKSVYDAQGAIELVVRLAFQPGTTLPSRPLSRAICELTITDLETRRQVLSKSYRLMDVAPDAPFQLALDIAEVQTLPVHRDLELTAVLRWPSQTTQSVCARGQHAIYLSRGWLFIDDAAGGKAYPLRDPAEYRAFWHKIWEGPERGEERTRWQLSALCRYYVTSRFDRPENTRVQTRLLADQTDDGEVTRQVRGRMKSGVELSLDELNKLLPRLGQREPLAPEQLLALKSTELRPRFDLEATAQLELTGRRTQLGVVWVYPEVTLRECVLGQVTQRDARGQVVSTREERVLFPFPSAVHFLTLRSN